MSFPERYAKTVAYMTPFRAAKMGGPDPVVYVFSNDRGDDPDAALTAADVFETLKPELVLASEGATITVGQRSFKGVTLRAPSKGETGASLPIGLDSMLLDQAAGQSEPHRKVGGKLFRRLLEDLDVVTRFSGPKFARVLLDVARIYLTEDVDTRYPESHQAGPSQIRRLMTEDPMVADAVLRVLQAPQSDAPRAERKLQGALSEAEIDAANDKDRDEIRRRFLESLVRLRDDVLIGGNTGDKTMMRILGTTPEDRSARERTRWFHEFAQHEDAFDLGHMRDSPPGASLPDLYQHYMHHAENVHRYVRAPVLHSFVFMWLMSKYKGYSMRADFPKTAAVAFERGVQGAADRKYGESDSDRARRKSAAAAAGEKTIDEFKPRKTEDGTSLSEADIELKKRMARRVVDAAAGVFDAETTFFRRQLQELLEIYFLDAAAATSGALKEVLDESRAFVSAYKNLYQRLLGNLNNPASFGNPKQLKSAIAAVRGGRHQEAIETVAEKASEVLSKVDKEECKDVTADDKVAADCRKRVRDEVLNAFADKVGDSAIGHFSAEFDAKAGKIKGQVGELTRIYRADRKISDASRNVESVSAGAGMPSAVASDHVLSAASTHVVAAAIAQGNPPTDQLFPNSADIQSAVDSGGSSNGVAGKIEVGGKSIGNVELTSEGTRVELDLTVFEEVEFDQDVELSIEDNEDITIDTFDPDGDIRAFIADAAHDRPLSPEDIEEQVKKLPEYGDQRESMRALYCGEEADDLDPLALDDFERAMRAVQFGEFLQAAPDSESRLGVSDISQTVRLMLDLVRNVGDLANDEQVKDEPDRKTTVALGPSGQKGGPKARLNLSTYFQVPDEDKGAAITEAMAYHERICESVSRVRDHLADINDLNAIATALPADAKLVVVNSTVSGHMSDLGTGRNFLPQYHHPSVVLLGRGAGQGADWTRLARHLENQFSQSGAEDVPLSCPFVVSHDKVDSSCPFPVAEFPGSFAKIGFVPAAQGVTHTAEALAVENARALLSMPAAIAVAPILRDSVLGKFPDEPVDVAVVEAVEASAGATFQRGDKGEQVVAFLRRCWRESMDNTALQAFVTARLATLAFEGRGQLGRSYQAFHDKFIGESFKSDHSALAGAGPLLGIETRPLVLIVGDGNTALHEELGIRFFDDSEVIRLKIDGVKKATGGDKCVIPEEMRNKLIFIGC